MLLQMRRSLTITESILCLWKGRGRIEAEDQAGKFVPLKNDKINAMKKKKLYDEIFQRGIKIK